MSNALTERREVGPHDMQQIRQTVARDCTSEANLAMYLHDCERQGVHPLDRLIHYTENKGKYTPITSIDLFRARASEPGDHAGTDDPVYQGEPCTPTFSATVTVYRIVHGQRCAWTATARWAEYYPGDGKGFMWRKMPYLMLGKCAEALCLRKAFPRQLHGLYVREEMDQAAIEVAEVTVKPAPAPAQIIMARPDESGMEPDTLIPADMQGHLAQAITAKGYEVAKFCAKRGIRFLRDLNFGQYREALAALERAPRAGATA